ncbi:MAG: hypothetical protein ABSA93_26460 [Streptosporangiaceae bacterium]|jgi:hypothetical protein
MTPHLTLEELIDETREHRDCQRCRDEAAAWAKVREGVRLRDSAAVPPTGVLESLLGELDQPPAGRRILKPLSAAAAVVVLAAGGYGAASALGHSTGATHAGTQHAELTATGCTGLELAGGTLAGTTGNNLVLTTISGNQLTVTTTSTTAIYREIVGTLGDIRDGDRVLANGSLDGGTLTATLVSVLPDTLASPATPPGPAGVAGIGLASGTVADAHNGGFTVVRQDGTRITVTVATDVTVITTARITVVQLITGKVTSAVGTVGADGTLAASTVEQDTVPAAAWQKVRPRVPATRSAPTMPAGKLPSNPPTKPFAISLNGLGCSPAAITTTYLLDGHL